MRSLKTKFIVAITFLIIIVITLTSGILIQQKKTEIQADIFRNARSFAELASPSIINLSKTQLQNDNFLFFIRDLAGLTKNNPDISEIKIFDFNGNVIFDSETEKLRQYAGEPRIATDLLTLQRIKSATPSVLNNLNQTYFIEKISPGIYDIIDQTNLRYTERSSLQYLRQLQNLIYPLDEQYAIQYNLTYENLNQRLFSAALQIGLLGLASILASILIGYILSVLVTRPIRKLTEIVKLIAKGDFSKRIFIKSDDEVGVLADSVNNMAAELEKSLEAKIYQEKTKKELEIAAKIQRDLLPSTIPSVPGLDIAAEVIPATEIGGDIYDILLDKNQTPYFYVGDVTGHGVPAGLISSVTNAIITSIVDLDDPVQIINNLNHVLKNKSAANIFITLLLARYKNSFIDYVSAGHEKPIYYSAQSNTSTYLNPGGIALGLFEDIADKLSLQSIQLQPGDIFILYTDGIPEAWATATTQFGEQKLLELTTFAAQNHSSATDIKNFILSELKTYMGTYEQKDDITLLVIKKNI